MRKSICQNFLPVSSLSAPSTLVPTEEINKKQPIQKWEGFRRLYFLYTLLCYRINLKLIYLHTINNNHNNNNNNKAKTCL